MRYGLCFILCIVLNTIALPQTNQSSFGNVIQVLKERDDAEGFIYAFVDEYLKQPNEERLVLFDQYEKTIWRPLATNEENLAYVILLCNKGYYLTQFSEIYKAIDAYEKAWKIFNDLQLTGFDIVEYGLKPLANDYSMLGDYASAANIIKMYLYQAEKERNYKQVASAFINLSIIYHDTGKYVEAIKLLQEALAIKTLDPERKGLVYSGLSRNYVSLHDYEQAKKFSTLALSAISTHRTTETPTQLVNLYKILAMISLRENKNDEASRFIKKAQSVAVSHRQIFQNRELAKLNNSAAEILKLNGAHPEALRIYFQSLKMLIPTQGSSQKVDTLPLASSLYAENAIKETLDGMADVYQKQNQPEQALACYELSFATEDLLRHLYNYEDARLQQQLENRARSEQVLLLLYDLYAGTKDKKYVIRAFQFAERTKAITLKENIEDKYSKKSLQNDSLTNQEQALQYKQATLSSEIIVEQMKQDQADVEYINQRIAQQSAITLALKAIRKAMEGKQHNIDSVKFNNLPLLQNKLKKDRALLVEYFAGNNTLFVFKISHNNIELNRIDGLPEVRKKILALNDLFSDASAINNDIEQYKNLSFELFQLLELPTDASIENLVLIPDGLLHLIPFDALLTSKCKGNLYNSFPYLIKKYSIVYQASAFIYCQASNKVVAVNKKLLALFPIFENTNHTLAYSQKEAEGIQQLMEGKYVFKEEATRNTFLSLANNYSIIHLSTHASAGRSPEPPSITFIDSTLYLPQIYGLKMNADLLVLSACETGAGVLVKGEGALSLARGFQFAGVQNIIFSLWKVNDYSTAALMVNFYRNFIDTKSKSQSLKLAKLDYLMDNTISNAHKSPYYWAGFVYYGSIDKQYTDTSWIIKAMILLATILVMLVIYRVYTKHLR